jgi:Rod binding domain-containing protein
MYRACLEFERFFVGHMLKGMDDGTKALSGGDDAGGGSSDESSGAATSTAGVSAYQDMVRDQMTQAVLDGGGLGVAGVLYGQMVQSLPATPGAAAAAGKEASA